ncbi:MAG TPA: SAM-dependent chlorinase/fluorinase [Chitinophagales bacterium]|nr:SAM-dependent chlorinase/fluorinase [Chitinophagales bacterium]HMU69019.1 SAM-dependent chlorinase/fluorinase [Chitinophagales bacterium]HMX03738.1 SAM-dependent chlorinase/fluorinase [Chitinophagales bacterium]HMZ89177.1 SAM-dependent chlorinase/fluorinase [Chitinophagales bacterium]HNA56829.1 SAM-dependent chlorinase/fluorinase [Chitinophagales bacterium]
MPIVTLTSDLGVKDYYVAVLKGKLLSGAPQALIVDISHEIAPFNIQEAAFVMRNACFHFPPSTIHLVSVHAESRSPVKAVAIRMRDQYFIGMDNGLFSLMVEDAPDQIVEIPISHGQQSSFAAKDILVHAAISLLQGKTLQQIGTPLGSLETKTYLRPPDNAYLIRANIAYIDRFGNLIINITKERFEKLRGGREFVINYKRTEEIREISSTYTDVPEGEKLALFNSSGYLEIAIHKGNASQLLGLHLDNTIQIEFE